jgi:hypothetical protein
MMTLYEKIMTLYPSLTDDNFVKPNSAIILQNDSDGNGDYIAKWEHPTLTRPTEAQLEAAE